MVEGRQWIGKYGKKFVKDIEGRGWGIDVR